MTLIVSPEWLLERLEDEDVVIVDCRFSLADSEEGARQYQASHISGASYLHLNRDLSAPVGKHGGRHPLPNPAELSEKFASIGIKSGETLVVAYDDSRFGFAARLWWLLRYLGHSRAAILDGGWGGWLSAGYPTSAELPQQKKKLGNFVPDIQAEMVVDIETVKARKDLPEVALVDSRDRDRYLGEREPIDPIAGSIPGAVNYPWKEVTDEAGKARSPEEQNQRWSELESAEDIIVYCGSGVTACTNLLSLAIAGKSDAKLYAGSWSDWCSYLV